jgi:hypothetical protein
MNYYSIKTAVEIKGIELDIEVYYEASKGIGWADDPGEIESEITSICKPGKTKPVSKRLSDKILELYNCNLIEYIDEDFAERGY